MFGYQKVHFQYQMNLYKLVETKSSNTYVQLWNDQQLFKSLAITAYYMYNYNTDEI